MLFLSCVLTCYIVCCGARVLCVLRSSNILGFEKGKSPSTTRSGQSIEKIESQSQLEGLYSKLQLGPSLTENRWRISERRRLRYL